MSFGYPICNGWLCNVMWWLLGFSDFMGGTSPWSWIVLLAVFVIAVKRGWFVA
jgi:hypothetical protein